MFVLLLTVGFTAVADNHTTATPTEEETDDESPDLASIMDDIWETFADMIPGLLMFVIIIIIGFLIAKAVGWVVSRVLRKLGFDKAMDRVGVDDTLEKVGVKRASRLIGKMMFWFVFAIMISIALAWANVEALTAIMTPIVLFIPRIIIAFLVLIIGLYVAEVIEEVLKKAIVKSPMAKELMAIDKKAKSKGMGIIDLMMIFVKVFVLLIFINIALEIVSIGVLSALINPILIVLPLVMVAFAIVIIGLIITEYVVKFIMKMLDEMEIDKFIQPVEKTIKKERVIWRLIETVLKIFIMLFFIQIAIGVLNSTGAFNMLASLVNEIILWIPNLLVGIFIVLIGFWLAGWIHDKIVAYGKDMDVPFHTMIAKAAQFLVVYIALTMAMAQVGIAVPILYYLFIIVVGAVFIGAGVGFAWGSKDIFRNMMGGVQTGQAFKAGQRIKVEGYEGTIESIERYHVVLDTMSGKVRIPHSKMIDAIVEETA